MNKQVLSCRNFPITASTAAGITTLITAGASLISPTADAVTVYDRQGSKASIGGYAGIRLLSTYPSPYVKGNKPGSTTEMVNGSSRIHFKFNQTLSGGWQGFSTLEWGLNPFGDVNLVYNNNSQFSATKDDAFFNRLAVIGFRHEEYGSFSFGRQWSVWLDVVGDTDEALVWGAMASGIYTLDGSGGVSGTGRADRSIQYRYQFRNLEFALQTQVQKNTIEVQAFQSSVDGATAAPTPVTTLNYDNTYGLAITYHWDERLKIAIGGNGGSFEGELSTANSQFDVKDEVYGIGITWSDLASPGFYFALNYNDSQYHNSDFDGNIIPDAYGIEAMASYNFGKMYRLYGLFNGLYAKDYQLDNTDNIQYTDYEEQNIVLGGAYFWTPALLIYLEGKVDFSKFYKVTNGDAVEYEGADGVVLGVRYTF